MSDTSNKENTPSNFISGLGLVTTSGYNKTNWDTNTIFFYFYVFVKKVYI